MCRQNWSDYARAGMSFNRGEFFNVDPLGPFLKGGRVLPLGFDLQKIALRDHEPERPVFAFVLERFKAVVPIDIDRLGITLGRSGGEFPGRGCHFDVVGVGRRIENAD